LGLIAMGEPVLVALDWGTSRMRAFLLRREGEVVDRVTSEDGIMAVPAGGFPAVLERVCGDWLRRWPSLRIVMAGMVGSRNGWAEAPYVECPASLSDVAARMLRLPVGGTEALIVPGLMARDADGVPDVMRGEETKIAGTGLSDGVVVMPGTHSKWARLKGGVVESFATFMTGDFYAALSEHTILSKLSERPEDEAGFVAGLAAARHPGGLTHLAFAARTRVLLGDMPGTQVGPYLSGLMIGREVAEGLAMLKPDEPVTLVADGGFARSYEQAFTTLGLPCRVLPAEDTFLGGLRRLADLAGAAS
jgi:2-dehydro-3-deoxygalactonokinase